MIDNRRVRFGNLANIEKAELVTASELWLEELVRAPWATRDLMKLAAHLVNYMLSANRANLHIREMETLLQLNREEISRSLHLMRLFRAVTEFSIDKDEVRASLYLSSLQMLRLIDLRKRQLALISAG